MGPIEKTWASSFTRRRALAAIGGLLAGSPALLHAQVDPHSRRQQTRVPSLSEMLDVFDFEPVARDNVSRVAWDFTSRAGHSEWSLRRNRHAFDWVELVDAPSGTVETVETRTTVLGTPMDHPIFVSPNALHGMMHPSGEAGTYQATSATGGLFVVANGPSVPHEDIAAAATGRRWVQSYPSQNLEFNRTRYHEWLDVGVEAIMITVDQQAAAYESTRRIRWLGGNAPDPDPVAGASAPPRAGLTGLARYGLPGQDRTWYSWDFMEALRDLVDVPVLIKGILTAEDARIVVERGFHGVVVSNHGARTLDYVPSTLEVLVEIVDAVEGRIPVLVDSGFRRGSDVFKALALGADAVGVGRATRWGLGAYGPAGAQRVLEIMERELREAMVRTGRRTIAEIDRTAVRTRFI